MRIYVLGEDTISAQARAYAEYRLFAALMRVASGRSVQHARVVLRRLPRERGCEGVACIVVVNLDGRDSIRVRTTADHAYAAINRAVSCLETTHVPPLSARRTVALH